MAKKNGSIGILPAHIRYSDMGSAAKLLYVELTCQLNIDGCCDLSDKELGELTGLKERQVRGLLKNLKNAGFVTSKRTQYSRVLQVFSSAQMAKNVEKLAFQNGNKLPNCEVQNGNKLPNCGQFGNILPNSKNDTLYTLNTTTTTETENSETVDPNSKPVEITPTPLPPAPPAPAVDSVTPILVTEKTTAAKSPSLPKLQYSAEALDNYCIALTEPTEGDFWSLMQMQVGPDAKSMLTDFLKEVKAMKKIDQGYSDFKKHFRSWALKQPKGGWNKKTVVPGAAPAQKPMRRTAATDDSFMQFYTKQ